MENGIQVHSQSLTRAGEQGPAQAALMPSPKPRTILALKAAFRSMEAAENPDFVLPLKSLRMTEASTIAVPELGTFELTPWARQQLASRLGIRWDRWFATMGPGEQSDEVNKRLLRSDERIRLRTARGGAESRDASGVLRAFVSPTFSPIADSLVAEILTDVLGSSAGDILRVHATDRTVSYVLGVGTPFRPGGSAAVGDVWGGIVVRNSGVGFSSLALFAHLHRLVCSNGMVAPVGDPVILERVHRGIDEGKVRAVIAERAAGLGGRLADGARRLLDGRRAEVADIGEAFLAILRRARVPQKHMPALEAAYRHEPEPTAFGVVQAVTLAAQQMAPELRFDLERAASAYLLEQPNRP